MRLRPMRSYGTIADSNVQKTKDESQVLDLLFEITYQLKFNVSPELLNGSKAP